MSRDDARERLGYLYVQVGKLRQDGKIMVDGIKLIYEAFIKRPTSMLLFDLLSFANQIENHDLMESLSKYIRPGMFGIGASGEILNSSSTP
jgi:hypothetical protein